MVLFTILVFSINSQTPLSKFDYLPGAACSVAVEANGKYFIGGGFTTVGKPLRSIAILDNNDNLTPENGWPLITGTVNVIIPDGSGGWFIGGSITKVGSTTVTLLARIKADKTVDASFTPAISGTTAAVNALYFDGATLFVGGAFTTVAGENRNNLASVTISSGALTTWNPNVTGTAIYTICPGSDGTSLYVGGSFTQVNGADRANIAEIPKTGNSPSGWNPSTNGIVRTIATYGYNVFAGGEFTTVNTTENKPYLAAFDKSTGTVTTWAPIPNGIVRSLYVHNSALYVGGAFTNVGSTPVTRNRAAAYSLSDMSLTRFDPNLSNTVNAIAVNGATVYLCGSFVYASGGTLSRRCLTAVDTTTGADLYTSTSFPQTAPNALSFAGEKLAVGGGFASFDYTRNRIAAFDVATGKLSTMSFNLTGAVNTMLAIGNTIYVGGNFTTVNGESRKYGFAFNSLTGVLLDWNPDANGAVNAMESSADGSTIYLGGIFTTVGGQTRNRLEAVNATTGVLTDWNPGAINTVWALARKDSTIYIGGTFTTVGGQTRNRLAAVNGTTGELTSWDPNSNNTVYALKVDNNTLYVGGMFTTLGSTAVPRNRAAAFSLTDGALDLTWNPNTTSTVRTIAVTDDLVYLGGDFTQVNGSTFRSRLAAVDKLSGTVSIAWIPSANSSVYNLTVAPVSKALLVAGNFTTMTNVSTRYFVVLENPSDPALPVELTSFSAKTIDGTVNLFWETKTEIDNYGFEIERSVAGAAWVKAGFVEGHGTSNSPKYYNFVDKEKLPGKVAYRLKQIDNDGSYTYSHSVEVNAALPATVTLEQNFPNPFNPETVIRYALPVAGDVSLKVYDATGRQVTTLVQKTQEAGNQSIVFSAAGSGIASGVYLYKLHVATADGRHFTQTRKLVVMK